MYMLFKRLSSAINNFHLKIRVTAFYGADIPVKYKIIVKNE